jgi:hypothetical protein
MSDISKMLLVQLTFNSLDRKEIKSAHSLTLSNDCNALSTEAVNFLYLASLASNEVVAAAVDQRAFRLHIPLPIRLLCSGVVRPLAVPSSSDNTVTVVAPCEAVELLRARPGIINWASRPCEAGRRSVGAGDDERDPGAVADRGDSGESGSLKAGGGTAAMI